MSGAARATRRRGAVGGAVWVVFLGALRGGVRVRAFGLPLRGVRVAGRLPWPRRGVWFLFWGAIRGRARIRARMAAENGCQVAGVA